MILGHAQLSGQYQLVVTRDGPLDDMLVRCEVRPDVEAADRRALERAVRDRIKSLVGISTTVEVLPPDSIERTLVGKARRVIDERRR